MLGYINHFDEHQNYKVIVVSNEDEILNSDYHEEKSIKLYKRIKEKLFGKTFRIESQLETALNNFISEISDENVKKFIEDNISSVKEIYIIADYQNLRHLKQSLWDFESNEAVIPDIRFIKEEE